MSIWERRGEIEVASSLSSYLAVAIKYWVYKTLARVSKTMHYGSDQAKEAVLEQMSRS